MSPAEPIERLTPERRRAQTRTHLLAAASDVFARRGYHSATLDEVAEVAGFSKGAVYSNFDSKEDLFLALIRQQGAELIDQFGHVSREGGSAENKLIAMRDVYADAEQRAEAWALWTEFTLHALRSEALQPELAAANRAMHELVVSLVEEQCADAGVVPPLPVDQLAHIYSALFLGLWQQQATDPQSVDDDLFPAAVLFVQRAVEQLGRPSR